MRKGHFIETWQKRVRAKNPRHMSVLRGHDEWVSLEEPAGCSKRV